MCAVSNFLFDKVHLDENRKKRKHFDPQEDGGQIVG